MPRTDIPHAPTLAAVALLAATAVVIAGCASTKVVAEWSDPQFAGRSLKGEKVLVVCDANETVIRRICQDQLAAYLTASGAVPVSGRADLTVGPPPANDKTLAAARSAGAKAILGSTIAPDATVVNPGPSVGFSLGGFGFGGGGGGVGAGVGVGVPVGSAQAATGYASDLVLTDVATGRLMWTSKATAPASQDVGRQIGELAKAGVEAAQKAGLF
jgi:hypothetical protein